MMRICHLLTATLLLCIASANAQEVAFSAPGGFYENPFELTLSCTQQDKVIHYTTNGNTPTANDPIYQKPLLLDAHLFSRSDIYTIPNCPDALWYLLNQSKNVSSSQRHCSMKVATCLVKRPQTPISSSLLVATHMDCL